jgi:hypothetical protein
MSSNEEAKESIGFDAVQHKVYKGIVQMEKKMLMTVSTQSGSCCAPWNLLESKKIWQWVAAPKIMTFIETSGDDTQGGLNLPTGMATAFEAVCIHTACCCCTLITLIVCSTYMVHCQ